MLAISATLGKESEQQVNPILNIIAQKVADLLTQGGSLISELEIIGWKDQRPDRSQEDSTDMLLEDLLTPKPISKIPDSFVQQYHQWYAPCLALVEQNMPSREDELIAIHQGGKGSKNSTDNLTYFLSQGKMTFNDQIRIADKINLIMSIVGSIPHYLDGRLYDLELALAKTIVGDELLEARTLLKARYIRAAGALAGVLLERSLKRLCDRQQPPIKYTSKNGTISYLNDELKKANIYDQVQWREIQVLGDIRNTCDHANTTEPDKTKVEDLINEVQNFISQFSI